MSSSDQDQGLPGGAPGGYTRRRFVRTVGAVGTAVAVGGRAAGVPSGPTATEENADRTRTDEEWPMYRADVTHTGRSDGSGPTDAVSVAWAFETLDKVQSSPAVVGGTLYVGSTQNTVFALDAATGEREWAFVTARPVHSSPAVVDGTVYVGGVDRNVYALDATDGTLEWVFATDAYVKSSPVVADGTVYIGSADGNVYALPAVQDDGPAPVGVGTARTGEARWVYETGGPVLSSPAVADGTVFVGSDDGSVYALDSDDGTQRWAVATDGAVQSSPAVVGGTVYVGSGDAEVYALDAATGAVRWRVATDDMILSSPAVADGTVFVGSADGSLYALDAATGDRRWTADTDGPIGYSSPAVTDETVSVGSTDGNVFGFDPTDGSRAWVFETGGQVWASPAVVEDTLYIASDDHSVYALRDPGSATPVAPERDSGTRRVRARDHRPATAPTFDALR